MATEILQINIHQNGNAQLNKNPLKVTEPGTIVWQLNPADEPYWDLLGIHVKSPNSNLAKQLIGWNQGSGFGPISVVNACSMGGDIEYGIVYAEKYGDGLVRVLDAKIENAPGGVVTTTPPGGTITIPVDIDATGLVTSPTKESMIVVTAKGVWVKWELTANAKPDWEIVGLAWKPPGPPNGEFAKPEVSTAQSPKWVKVKDHNNLHAEYGYSLLYKRKGSDEVLVFDPAIRNVPPD